MSVQTRERVPQRPGLVPVPAAWPLTTGATLQTTLEALRRRVPEATDLSLAFACPAGTDAAVARHSLLAQIECWASLPPWFEGNTLALDVAATGTAADFCAHLATTLQAQRLALLLELPQQPSPVRCAQSLHEGPDALRCMINHWRPAAPANTTATVTLAARWLRSRDDAQWAIEQGLSVRLVPGVDADPQQPQRDPGAGLRTLVRQLAGKVPHVTLAYPDPGVTLDSLRVLRKAGAACDVELGLGGPQGALRQVARSVGVRPRLYFCWKGPVLREARTLLNTTAPQ